MQADLQPLQGRWETLLSLCDHWRLLTRQESEGIANTDWREVKRCQLAKQELQPQITAAIGALHAQAASERAEGRIQVQLHALAGELIALEEQNGEQLRLQRQ